jgi:hypothetical protein
MIEKTISIEELVEIFPPSVGLLSGYGIRCLRCGEPSWGTLNTVAKEKNITDTELEKILAQLNEKYSKYNKAQNNL